MRKVLFTVAALALLCGCAYQPPTYYGEPRAVAQSMATCRANSNTVAAQSSGQGPMFAAAMQQQYINDCMAAAGHPIQ